MRNGSFLLPTCSRVQLYVIISIKNSRSNIRNVNLFRMSCKMVVLIIVWFLIKRFYIKKEGSSLRFWVGHCFGRCTVNVLH